MHSPSPRIGTVARFYGTSVRTRANSLTEVHEIGIPTADSEFVK